MSSKVPTADKGIDLPTHADYIGRDEDGFNHYFSGYEQTIYVLRDGKRVHVRELPELTGLAQWVMKIAGRKGWDELRYSDGSTADFLTEKLEEAVD